MPALPHTPSPCRQLLEAAPQRRLGLALLLQFAAPLLAAGSQQQQQQQQQRRHQQRWGGVRADADFWRLLRVCLRDGEPANRKRAAAILQLAVAETDGELSGLRVAARSTARSQ